MNDKFASHTKIASNIFIAFGIIFFLVATFIAAIGTLAAFRQDGLNAPTALTGLLIFSPWVGLGLLHYCGGVGFRNGRT